MRLLVTGASGLLGLNLALYAGRAHDIVGLDRSNLASPPFRVVEADLLDEGAFARSLQQVKPDAVIHCAAIADVDACEQNPVLARRTNAELAGAVADVCASRRVKLLHISTDAVFSGEKSGAYLETDEPGPRGVYATTKLDGERAVLRTDPSALVARVNFYGWSLTGKRSLAEFFVNNLSAGSMVNGFIDVTFCPMFINHLAAILLLMLQADLRGLYHVLGPQAMTKYQFGVQIARKFGLQEALISGQSVERSKLTASRSHNLWLSTNKLSTDLHLVLPDFSTGLDAFHAQYQQGYPQQLRSYQQALRPEAPAPAA